MSVTDITALVSALAALVTALGTLAAHLQLRKHVRRNMPSAARAVAPDWQGR